MAGRNMSFKQLFRLVVVFSLLWISLSHAEDNKPSEKAASPKRYRLSGALLFVNWDSFQIFDIFDTDKIKAMSIGELFRKAHGIFQGSEFKGKISIELPSGETKAIFDSGGDFDYIQFAAVRYFSIEYTGPPAKKVKITCDLTEDDVTSEDDVVCSGSASYRVRKPTDSMSALNKNKDLGGDALLMFVKMFVKQQGYHKLHSPYGAADMDAVIDYLYDLAKKFPDVSAADAVNLLEDVLGIYLVGLTLEEIKDPISKPGNYKRVDDAWSISDPGLGGNELFGQLYMLPQASTLKVCDLLTDLMQIECPEKLKDLELPIIQGPAFPLFDYSRVYNSINDFSISSGQKLPISAYYKNENEHSYVVFSNLWELDGNTALALDDCISKGNALGFDLIDWKTFNQRELSKCCYSGDRSISLVKEGEVIQEQESNLVEYQLNGVFSFQCDSDGLHGSEYEPFGSLAISAGNRNINQNYKIWQSGANKIAFTNGGMYRQPFMVRFQESERFMDEANNKITLHGQVKEDDPTGDDMIGNYDGKSYEANSLSKFTKLEFKPDSQDRVTIELQLSPVTAIEKPTVLKDYHLSGNFEFSCDNDGVMQNYYEPYGSFSIDIGNRAENRDIEVWHWVRNEHEIKCYHSVEQSISIDFKEVEDFMSPGKTDNKIVLHGSVLELDTTNSDVIGDYEGASYKADTLAEMQEFKFSPDYQDRVIISLQISEKTMALASKPLPVRSTKVVQMNSKTERQFAHKVVHAIFPLNKPGDNLAADKTRQEL